jgi:hypothetical protein
MSDTDSRERSLAELVGEVSLAWNFLELLAKDLVGRMLTPDRTAARIVTWDAGWVWLNQQLLSLGRDRIRDPELRVEYLALVRQIQEVNEDRNVIVHSHWQGAPPAVGQVQFLRMRFRGRGQDGPRIEEVVVTVEELEGTLAAVRTAISKLIDMVNRLAGMGIIYSHAPAPEAET